MATNRDVNLTIKAKNAASDTIKEVTNALKALKGEQKTSTTEATRSTSVLSRLGAEYRNLTGSAERLKAASKIADNIRQMSGAVERLGNSQRQAAEAMSQTNEQLDKTKAKSNQLSARQKELTANTEKLKAETDQLKISKRQLLKEITKETTLYNKVGRAAAKAEAGRGPSFGRTAASSAEIFAGNNLAEMRSKSLALAAAIEKNEANLKALGVESRAVKSELTATGSEIKSLSKDADKASTAFEQTTSAWKAAGQRLAEVQDAARKGGLNRLIEDQGRLEKETQETVAEMSRLEKVMASLGRFSTGEGGFTDPRAAAALQKQVKAVDEAREHYRLLSEEHRKLSSSARAAIGPQSKAAIAARQMGAAADAARRELAAQEKILARMPGSAAAAGGALRGMFKGYARQGRTALSITQRLRAEVFSLVLAYGGLHSAIQVMNDVVHAQQQMEAAQNRLLVVVGGSNKALGNEIGFLSRQAARLGIDFSILSDEYSKFAVAADAANFTAANTRKVFLSVAEAGRVNKLSMDQMRGVMLALQQMISKGKVTSEELRRQMGDRLPGAFNIFADAVGMTTAELDKMMKAGQVMADEETMLKFADELNDRFGPQLSDSLRTTTTLLGKFANELFQAKLRMGEGGFIDSLNDALKELIEYFRSREGRDFFLNLGAAMGKVISIVPTLVENFSKIMFLIRTFVAFKLSQWFIQLLVPMGRTGEAFRKFRSAFAVAKAEMIAGRGVVAALSASFGTLRAAMLAIPGGIILAGLSLALSAVMGKWLDGVDDVVQKVDEHNRIMGLVISSYEEAKNKAEDWRDAIPKGVDLPAVETNFFNQLDVYNKKLKEFQSVANRAFNNVNIGWDKLAKENLKFSVEFNKINKSFDSKDIDSYIDKLKELKSRTTDVDQTKAINAMLDYAKSLKAAENRMENAATVANEMGSNLLKVKEIAEKTGKSMDDLAEPIEKVKDETVKYLGRTNDMWVAGEAAMGDFHEKMKELAKFVPELAAKMEELDQKSKLDNLKESLGWLAKIPQIAALFEQAKNKINIDGIFKGSDSGGVGATAALLKQFEGFQPTAKWDVNAFRAGFGSDTVTLADGSIHKITKGMRVSVEDANRDLYRRIGEFQNVVKGQIGSERFDSFSDRQQAVLTSIAYNYGSLPDRIVSAIRTGTVDTIASAIGNLGTDNDGVNAKRRETEAAIFRQGGTPSGKSYAEAAEQRRKDAEQAKKDAEEASARTKETIADNQFAIEQQDLINQGKARQAAIEAAIREAKANDPNITAEQLEQIKAQAAALWDKNNALTAEEQKQKKIEEHNTRITALEAQRNALLEQRKLYEEQGDQEKLDATDQALVGINAKLAAAYDGALAFWQSIGGQEADAAIAKLQLAKEKLGQVQQKTLITGREINERLADGMAGAFDAMAQAIANGENAIEAFGRAFRRFAAEFLIEIGKMIIKQALLNALQSAMGGGGGIGGAIAGAIGKIFHEGGIAGDANAPSRVVNAAWFNNATRYHSGGISGLKPNEIPAILEKGEEILPENDPRHIANIASGGGSSQQSKSMQIVNAFDAPGFLEAALSSDFGKEVYLNFVQANKDELKTVLEG